MLIQQLKAIPDGSNRMMVNDTRGVLYITDTNGSAAQPWFDIRSQNVGFSNSANATQTGLMSFAFHPNFGRDPGKPGYATFYTMDTSAPTGRASWGVAGGANNHENVLHEWTVADPHAASATILASREVLRVAQPYSDHGAGTIAFNPAATSGSSDYGALYIGFGDGGASNDPLNSAQNLTSPFGKILRIDPVDPDGAGPRTYGIPAGNPFAAQADARPEVWAYGLRNPQNFTFDSTNGAMLIADIGQNQIEEVNVGFPGRITAGRYAKVRSRAAPAKATSTSMRPPPTTAASSIRSHNMITKKSSATGIISPVSVALSSIPEARSRNWSARSCLAISSRDACSISRRQTQ